MALAGQATARDAIEPRTPGPACAAIRSSLYFANPTRRMPHAMREVWSFIRAVLRRWTALVTSSLSVALLLVLERLTGKSIDLWFFISVFVVVFIVWACFFVWRDEHRALIAEQAFKSTTADALAELQGQGRKIYVRWWTGCHNTIVAATEIKTSEEWRVAVLVKLEKDINRAEAIYFNTPKAAEALPPTSIDRCPQGILINELGHRIDRLGEIVQRLLQGARRAR
jgi:hypothetical protein